MTIKFSMIKTGEGAAFVIDGKPLDCSNTHENYEAIMNAVKAKEYDKIENLINIRKAIANFVAEAKEIVVMDDHITWGGKRIGGTIVDRIFAAINEGFDAQPLILFLTNLYQNPVQSAIDELYDFLETSKMPITEDGHFYAYKRVNDDYTSIHDGKFDNSIGTQPTMERSEVDANRHNHCSRGLHFCSYGYLGSFTGQRTLLLKVNPADVVSIPSDYDNTKGRAWTYYVEAEVDQGRDVLSETKSVVKSSVDVPTTDNYVSAAPEVLGYDAGYRHKRYKEEALSNPFEDGSFDANAWEESFKAGVDDAKKRVARKFKAPAKAKAVA